MPLQRSHLSSCLVLCLALALPLGLAACGDAASPASPASAAAPAAATDRLLIFANDEPVGHVAVEREGDRYQVDYHVDNNGRGPKHRLVARLDPQGLPLEIEVAGTSLMGAAVEEHYQWSEGRAEWRSQADSGEVAAPAPPLYIVNDDNPWVKGMYVRALLQAPGHELDALPAGRLKLSEVHAMEVGEGAARIPVKVYVLVGLDTSQDYYAVDEQGRLFAEVSGERGWIVREGYEAAGEQLATLAQQWKFQHAKDLQQRLAHRPEGDVRIHDVRVFDSRTATLGAPASVLVSQGRIKSIDPLDPQYRPAADEVVFDGGGGTLIPGLADMHAHNSLESAFWYLAAGVTTTRDQGNNNAFLLDLLPRIESGEIAGPRISPNGFIEGRSPHSAKNGFVIETLDEGLDAVRWYAEHGYRQIKIYNSMNPEFVKPLAAEAHRLGLGVSGHVPAFTNADAMIEAGYDDIAHINQLMLGWVLEPDEDTRTPLRLSGMARAAHLDLDSPRVRRTVALMKQHDVALDVTAYILERLMLSRAGQWLEDEKLYIDHLPVTYQRSRKRTMVPDLDETTEVEYREGFERLLQTVKLLHDEGITLLPGTDNGMGFTVHRELELFERAGIPSAEVLRIATLGSAHYLGRDGEQGTLEPGKLADLVLLDGDPTQGVRAVRKPRLVMKGDVYYFPAEIYTALGVRPFAEAPRRLSKP